MRLTAFLAAALLLQVSASLVQHQQQQQHHRELTEDLSLGPSMDHAQKLIELEQQQMELEVKVIEHREELQQYQMKQVLELLELHEQERQQLQKQQEEEEERLLAEHEQQRWILEQYVQLLQQQQQNAMSAADVDSARAAGTLPKGLDADAVEVTTVAVLDASANAGSTPVLFKVSTGPLSSPSTRAPLNLAIVLDKSGSMAGDKLHSATEAIIQIIEQLDSEDVLHLITYSDEAEVVFQMGNPVEQRKELVTLVRGVVDGGATNLGAGLELAASILPQVTDERYNRRVFVFSDGLLTEGVKHVEGIRDLVSAMAASPVSAHCDSFGIGAGFDADIMETIASAGLGTFFFLESPESISTVVQNALTNLREVVAQSAVLTVRSVLPVTSGVQRSKPTYEVLSREGEVCGPISVWNDHPGLQCEEGLVCAPPVKKAPSINELSGEEEDEELIGSWGRGESDVYAYQAFGAQSRTQTFGAQARMSNQNNDFYGYDYDYDSYSGRSICQQAHLVSLDEKTSENPWLPDFAWPDIETPKYPDDNLDITTVSIQLGDLPADNVVSHLVDLHLSSEFVADPFTTTAAEWSLTYSTYDAAQEEWVWSTISGETSLEVLSPTKNLELEQGWNEVMVALVVQNTGAADDMVKALLSEGDAGSAMVVQRRQIEDLQAVENIDSSGIVTSLLTMARDALDKLEIEGASENMVQNFNHQSYAKKKGDGNYAAQFASMAMGG